MSARGARRAKGPIIAANPRPHSNPSDREHLRRENERLLREIGELRRKLADAEKQIAERDQQTADAEKEIADAEKQIAELEQQLALRRLNSTNSSKPLPPTGWPATRGRAEQNARAGANRAPSRDMQGIIGGWFPPPR